MLYLPLPYNFNSTSSPKMSNQGWQRRSSSLKTGSRTSLRDYFNAQVAQANRNQDPNSKIPVRSSSSSSAPSKDASALKRSNTLGPPIESTPQSSYRGNPGKITPLGSCFTPKFYGSYSSKKGIGFGKEKSVQDKEFQREAYTLVSSYFEENCPAATNGSDIRQLSMKMFIDMINHLFERLGIYNKNVLVQFATTSFKEELPHWLNSLGYPRSITKGYLQTVSAPQYWPHMLGLLSWLVGIVYAGALFDTEAQMNKNMSYLDLKCLQGVMKAHNLMSNGNDNAYEEVSLEVLQAIAAYEGVSDEEISRLQAEKAKLEYGLNDPEDLAEQDALDELEQRLVLAESIAKKNRDQMESKDNITLKTVHQQEMAERKIQSLIKEEVRLKRERDELKEVVTTQAMSINEVTEIKKKCEFLQKEINYMNKEIEDQLKLIEKCDHETAAKRDKILQNAHAFNRSLIQLELHVPDLKGFRARVDPDSPDVVADVEKLVASLRTLRRDLIAKCDDRHRVREGQIRKIEKLRQRLKDASSNSVAIRGMVETKSDEIAKLKADVAEAEKSKIIAVNSLKNELAVVQRFQKEHDELKTSASAIERKVEIVKRGKILLEERINEKWGYAFDKASEIKSRMSALQGNVKENERRIEQQIQELIDRYK